MPWAKKPYKPKRQTHQDATAVMFPNLHKDVGSVLIEEPILPEWWFHTTGGDSEAIDEYPTNVMGGFDCRNPGCLRTGWSSKKIAILIRRFPDNGYNAEVFKQRCKSCKELGALRLDENAYVERVAYRLKKWAGISVETPPYNGVGTSKAPHETYLMPPSYELYDDEAWDRGEAMFENLK
ncbi:hypothetical protein N0V88_006934 [Collariella sp. IMI 366227]|nr:hypothetical protein N0V88_006934 [Collariella sp. IMI 366227]